MGIFSSKTNVTIITCGLDNAGKSTIINELKPQEQRQDAIAATFGYSVEEFDKGSVAFKVFDMGGARKFRELWSHHFKTIQGIIFVIDSSDRARLCLVKDELQLMLENPEIRGVPVLFFANKMDMPGALTPQEIVDAVGIIEMCSDRAYNIFASDARRAIGVEDGLQWLQKKIAPNA
jgi:ADP-ribosylation factor-like protein 6